MCIRDSADAAPRLPSPVDQPRPVKSATTNVAPVARELPTYILCAGDQAFVPRAKKNFFYKFWRTVELDLLKQDSIDSNKLWKAAGKTRSETIFTRRQSSVKDFVMNMC